jgi:epoxide hydrolase-like predicted phosphatase
MTEGIEAIVFDWGGVLIDDPAPGLMDHCAKALGVGVDAYVAAHKRHGEFFQKGKISEGVFWQRVCGDLDRPEPEVASLWGEAFRAVYSPRKAVFDLVRQLQETGYKTAVLSNTEVAAMEFFGELGYDMFDALVFSCAEGTFKPERRIYVIAARKLGVDPERCVFVDDKQVYVDGAVDAGMKGVLYGDFKQVCQALREQGVTL